MNQVYLWESGASTGPFYLGAVWARIRDNRLEPGTLFSFDQADWQPLSKLPPESLPVPVPSNVPSPQIVRFERRSDWAGFLRCLGGLCAIAGIGTGIIMLEHNQSLWPVIAITLAAVITCFFWAFLVDVFTDIRWLLNEQLQGSMKSDSDQADALKKLTR